MSILRSMIALGASFLALATQAGAEERNLQEPKSGLRLVASAGQVIYKTTRLNVQPISIATTQAGINRTIYLTEKIDLPAGSTLIKPAGDLSYCSAGTGYISRAGQLSMCLTDHDRDGNFDEISGPGIVRPVKLKQAIPYSAKISEQILPKGQFATTLTYAGVSAGALRLSYREFADDMARPAFTEELSIPLEPSFPQPIVVKGVRFELHKLDGVGLEYQIVARPAPTQISAPAATIVNADGYRTDGPLVVPIDPGKPQ